MELLQILNSDKTFKKHVSLLNAINEEIIESKSEFICLHGFTRIIKKIDPTYDVDDDSDITSKESDNEDHNGHSHHYKLK